MERTHRTLDGFVGLPDPTLDLTELQARLDQEREMHNRWLPSRASDCAARPPLVAHPELLRPRRPYAIEWERELFDEQRVYDYLAGILLERKVSRTGQIQLGGRSRSVGRAAAGQVVRVVCDAATHEWIVCVASDIEIKRLPIHGLDASSLTGIADVPMQDLPPLQLTLPLVA